MGFVKIVILKFRKVESAEFVKLMQKNKDPMLTRCRSKSIIKQMEVNCRNEDLE